MSNLYLTKKDVYHRVSWMRDKFGIVPTSYPLDCPALCVDSGAVDIRLLPFTTKGLRGVAIPASGLNSEDTILLNSNRRAVERNFDCAHELFHIVNHRNLRKQFFCNEVAGRNQDSFIEWQANEGGAEFIVPMVLLLLMVKSKFSTFETWENIESFQDAAAYRFQVTRTVIQNRLNTLRYEIYQHLSGTALNCVEILSDKAQERKNIDILSLDELEERIIYKSLNGEGKMKITVDSLLRKS